MDKKEITTEDLAGMINKGFTAMGGQISDLRQDMDSRFERVETRLDGVETRLDGVETRLDHVDARLGRIEADVKELRGEIVYRHEFEDVLGRVKYLEKKMGIESGK